MPLDVRDDVFALQHKLDSECVVLLVLAVISENSERITQDASGVDIEVLPLPVGRCLLQTWQLLQNI